MSDPRKLWLCGWCKFGPMTVGLDDYCAQYGCQKRQDQFATYQTLTVASAFRTMSPASPLAVTAAKGPARQVSSASRGGTGSNTTKADDSSFHWFCGHCAFGPMGNIDAYCINCAAAKDGYSTSTNETIDTGDESLRDLATSVVRGRSQTKTSLSPAIHQTSIRTELAQKRNNYQKRPILQQGQCVSNFRGQGLKLLSHLPDLPNSHLHRKNSWSFLQINPWNLQRESLERQIVLSRRFSGEVKMLTKG